MGLLFGSRVSDCTRGSLIKQQFGDICRGTIPWFFGSDEAYRACWSGANSRYAIPEHTLHKTFCSTRRVVLCGVSRHRPSVSPDALIEIPSRPSALYKNQHFRAGGE